MVLFLLLVPYNQKVQLCVLYCCSMNVGNLQTFTNSTIFRKLFWGLIAKLGNICPNWKVWLQGTGKKEIKEMFKWFSNCPNQYVRSPQFLLPLESPPLFQIPKVRCRDIKTIFYTDISLHNHFDSISMSKCQITFEIRGGGLHRTSEMLNPLLLLCSTSHKTQTCAWS